MTEREIEDGLDRLENALIAGDEDALPGIFDDLQQAGFGSFVTLLRPLPLAQIRLFTRVGVPSAATPQLN